MEAKYKTKLREIINEISLDSNSGGYHRDLDLNKQQYYEGRLIELINKILSNERETVRKHEHNKELCSLTGNTYADCCLADFNCNECKYRK